MTGGSTLEFTPADSPDELVEIDYEFTARYGGVTVHFPTDPNLEIWAPLAGGAARCSLPSKVIGSGGKPVFATFAMPELSLPDKYKVSELADDPTIIHEFARSYVEFVSWQGYLPVVQPAEPRDEALRSSIARNVRERNRIAEHDWPGREAALQEIGIKPWEINREPGH